MGVKNKFDVVSGPLAQGLSTYDLRLQGYASGVIQVKIRSKSTDGTVTVALTEFIDESDGDGILVTEALAAASDTDTEWRTPVELPGLHYKVEVYSTATSADAQVALVAR